MSANDLPEPIEPISAPGLFIHDDGDGLEIVTDHGSPDFQKWKIAYWDLEALRELRAMCDAILAREGGA